MSEDVMLSVRDLRIETSTGSRRAILNGISFSLKRGQMLGIIGESGSGKSTLGLAALGYLRGGLKFSGGEVCLNNVNLCTLPRISLASLWGSQLAYVAQSASTSFNPAQPLGKQITEAAVHHRLMTLKEARQRAIELLEILGLPRPDDFIRRYPHQVSGGQLQRAMIAQALCTKPSIIVFDEPTTALDVTTQAEVLLAIRRAAAATDITGLYVSHDLPVVAQVADDILVLKGGRTVEYGSMLEILRNPKNSYTKSLLNAQNNSENYHDTSDKSKVILSIDGVSSSYADGRDILNGVTLDFPERQTVAIVGSSGSGKTTLGRVICGIQPTSSGTLRFRGEMLPRKAQDRQLDILRRIQFIYQNSDAALNPRHNVETIIGRPLTLYRSLKGERRREEILRLLSEVELSPAFLTRKIQSLSGGQKQRVCIARALAAKPDLIVCDEPTSALDPLVASNIVKLLARLQVSEGLTLLLITHDIKLVRNFTHEVVIIDEGRVVQTGKTSDVLSSPINSKVADFLASTPEIDAQWLDRWSGRRRSIA